MMETKEILAFCLEKGLLLDEEVLNFFSEEGDVEGVKVIIEKVSNHTQQKMITKEVFKKNREKVDELFQVLPAEKKKILEMDYLHYPQVLYFLHLYQWCKLVVG